LRTFTDDLFLVISSIQHTFLSYLPQLFTPMASAKFIKPGSKSQGFLDREEGRAACKVAGAGVH
jgi:hypothetical protein